MIYLDREKNKKVDIKPNGNNYYQLTEDNTYYVYGNAKVDAYNNAKVKAFNNSEVNAYDNSEVEAYNRSLVYAYNFSKVEAYDFSKVDAYHGDYIIKGVEGEFYPCKPRIFKKNIWWGEKWIKMTQLNMLMLYS